MSDNGEFTPGRPLRVYDPSGQWHDYSTDDLVGLGLNRFEGWRCGLGLRSLRIDMDGNVDGASCRVGGQYGNVFTDFQLPEGDTVCPVQLCTCGADLFIPKYREDKDLALLGKTLGQPVEPDKRRGALALEEMRAMERTHASSAKQVYWEIGRRCNFDCSYCWPWIHNNHERHKTLEELIGATLKIFEKFGRGEKLNFIISGGEPTLNPAFLDWVRFVAGFGHHLSMHSNGSRLAPYYRELIHYGDLNLSVHFEFWNRDKMLKNIEEITQEKVKHGNQGVGHLEVKIMMAPGRRPEALELEERLREIRHFTDYCTWAMVPIRDGNAGDRIMQGYEPEDFALFGDRR